MAQKTPLPRIGVENSKMGITKEARGEEEKENLLNQKNNINNPWFFLLTTKIATFGETLT
jgi:hypothetical protein